MKIHVLSDLHLECSSLAFDLGAVPSDVVVLAGDIHAGVLGIEWAATTWTDRPVVYVPGNHEFYRREYNRHRQKMHDVADQFGNVILLDRTAVVIEDVLFAGATLWTDYEFRGAGDLLRKAEAMSAASMYMSDHQLIRIGDEVDPTTRRFLPEDAAGAFELESGFLQKILKTSPDELSAKFQADRIRKKVVVTHHLPSALSVHDQYAHSVLNASFASHLDGMLIQSDLWVHGHTHCSFDYFVTGPGGKRTRVVCNSRGYSRWDRDVENYAFSPQKIVEI